MVKKENNELYGIKGWLSFFIFTLVISIVLNLLAGIVDIQYVVEETGLQGLTLWGFVLLDILNFGGIIALAIYALTALSKFKDNAISVVKIFLGVILISNVLSLIFSILAGTIYDSEDTLSFAFRGIIYGTIWLLYFNHSNRVKITYPENKRKTHIFDTIIFFSLVAIPLAIYGLAIITSGDSGSSFNSEQMIVNGTDVVSPEMYLTQSFTLYREAYVNLDITTTPYANVYLIESPEYSHYELGETFYYIKGGSNLASYSSDGIYLSAGEYILIMEPSENKSITISYAISGIDASDLITGAAIRGI